MSENVSSQQFGQALMNLNEASSPKQVIDPLRTVFRADQQISQPDRLRKVWLLFRQFQMCLKKLGFLLP